MHISKTPKYSHSSVEKVLPFCFCSHNHLLAGNATQENPRIEHLPNRNKALGEISDRSHPKQLLNIHMDLFSTCSLFLSPSF